MMCGRSGTCGTSEWASVWQWQSRERAGLLMTSAEKGTREREKTKNSSQCSGREREKTRQRSVEKRTGQNGRTCDSMRFTAALRRFIAPSKHKMPGREACMRVGTPPLHFYRWLPVKPGNIPRFLAPRSRPAISNLFPLPSQNAVTGSLMPLLFRLLAKSSRPFWYHVFYSPLVLSRKVHPPLSLRHVADMHSAVIFI